MTDADALSHLRYPVTDRTRPDTRYWRLDRSKSIEQTVSEATGKVIAFYRPALRRLAA